MADKTQSLVAEGCGCPEDNGYIISKKKVVVRTIEQVLISNPGHHIIIRMTSYLYNCTHTCTCTYEIQLGEHYF